MKPASPSPVLAYAPDRTYCKRLVTVGAALAKKQHRSLALLFVQPQELVSQSVADDIQTVYNIASREKAEVTVLFSDEPLLSLAVHARQIKAAHIVVDENGILGQQKLSVLRRLLPDIPVTVLQNGGESITFPPSESKPVTIGRSNTAN